jgi:hypothetical protein
MWLTSGTMVEIFAALGRGGQVKTDRYALRVKSPEPPMPFIICFVPSRACCLTLPKISTSMAVLMEMTPSRRITSGLLLISCGRSRMRERNHSRLS